MCSDGGDSARKLTRGRYRRPHSATLQAMISNVGGAEVFIVAVIALIAVGPEQLPGVIRKVGQSAAKIRAVANNMKSEFMSELDDGDVDALRQLSNNPGSFLMGTGTDDDPVIPRQASNGEQSTKPATGAEPKEGGVE